jgi:hypothetical protein
MADMTFPDRQALEKGFRMEAGFVLGFSDRTFQEFIYDSVGRNIYTEAYAFNGQSKAKRLRAFIKVEPNHIVGKLLGDLVEHAKSLTYPAPDSAAIEKCQRVVDRLRQGAPVLAELPPETRESTFKALADSVRKSLDENKPEEGLDRLHCYFVSYVRQVCEDNGITATRDEPAHSVLGKYVKHLKAANRIESEMTGRILTYAQTCMDAFNRVRNESSLAHPNQLLNYQESLLIFNHVVAVVNFIHFVEQQHRAKQAKPAAAVAVTAGIADAEIPF